MTRPLPSWTRRAVLPLLACGLAGCGGAAGEGTPDTSPAPAVGPAQAGPDTPFDPAAAAAEIAAFVPGEGETLDVVEVRDEKGALSLRRGVLRDADGMLNHGHFVRWHSNGQMAEDGWYFKGAKHGTYAMIAESGLKQTEQNYQYGVRQGLGLSWGGLGLLKERALYSDGVLEGLFETFGPNGPRSRGHYHAGVEEGLWTWWLDGDNKEQEGAFERGQKVGLWTFWRASGVLKSEEHYAAGVLQGSVVEYDEQGSKSAERSYEGGGPHGLALEFYPDGSERSRIEYVAGVPHGPQSRWYPDGVLQMQGIMEQGKRVGVWVYNQSDGARNEAWSGTYEADVRVGD